MWSCQVESVEMGKGNGNLSKPECRDIEFKEIKEIITVVRARWIYLMGVIYEESPSTQVNQ